VKARELAELGIPRGEGVRLAGEAIRQAKQAGIEKSQIPAILRDLAANPETYQEHPVFGPLAVHVAGSREKIVPFVPRETPAPYQVWGSELDADSLRQMENACQLPVAVRGAIMPDAHVGYGLPIGGVLATGNAVIPYAVGVDIACRMKITVLDLPVAALSGQRERLVKALENETRFGVGATFVRRREHAVMDEDWGLTPAIQRLKDKAWAQLGTSGSGNHFVEFGTLQIQEEGLGPGQGTYLALLSHSGSRGAGSVIATHYSRLAMAQHPELPKSLQHLAWLDLDSEAGQEYWAAMELMGRYAAANHACIHRHIARALGAKVLLDVENHHNFAWKEEHDGETVIVHRKGATPAGEGLLGIIPGSMASPAYLVRGKGNPSSLYSASHGAGRKMSRKVAKESFTWSSVKKHLAERGVELLSAGLDEVPMAYKEIDRVMADQADLVRPIARFDPKLVKMAPGDEPPED
jgi:tRNA-splicing ligase RtcB (3'-phosphate/5'-hydroxy nucleic acid ligase)